MLIPAVARKDELEKLFALHIYDDDMFLYNGYPYCNKIPDLSPQEEIYKWAIVNKIEAVEQEIGFHRNHKIRFLRNHKSKTYTLKEEVVGYFTYHIDIQSDNVNWFGLYSFKKDATIGFDIYRKMKELIRQHRRIEWRMIGDNPVQKHYDKFIEHFNGRKVVLKKAVKDQNGVYHDDYIYEILNE